jgi:hypothetical protein
MNLQGKLRAVPTNQSLRLLNAVLAGLYLVQAVAVLAIGERNDFSVSVSFLTQDSVQTAANGGALVVQATKHAFDLNVVYLVAAALLVGAAVTASAATWRWQGYQAEVATQRNWWRWLGCGLIMSLLVVAVALLSGVYDLGALLALVVLVAVVHIVSGWTEVLAVGAPKERQIARILNRVLWVAGLGVGMILLISFVANWLYATWQLPASVDWLVGTVALSGVLFALSVERQTRRPLSGQRYRLLERWYLVLTFLTATVLGWQIVAGVFH